MNYTIDSTEPVFSIGMVAEKFKISVHTLRLYEAEGLIIPHKTKSGRRLYSSSDINRISCIREMLEKKGLNFSGIRSMLSISPCWILLPCSEDDRKNCDAYTETGAPCWLASKKGDACKYKECRECHVYQGLSNCHNFKEYLKNIMEPNNNE